MRLAQLRRQMLIAIGLPACWTQATTAPRTEPPPPREVVGAPPRHEPDIAMFDPRSCTVDAIVETMCGRVKGDWCQPTADKLDVSSSADGLYVTSIDVALANAKDFILDDKRSEELVLALQAANEKLDGRPACCYSRCTPIVVGTAKPAPQQQAYYMFREQCLPPPPQGTTQPDTNHPECPRGVSLDGDLRPFAAMRDDKCCYTNTHRRVMIRKGRPARVAGEPRFAAIGEGTAWHAEIAVADVPPAIRARLAASWLEAARMEHASIAAFSATSLRLLALGAPPELIAATHAAALDEIEHARIAFAIASAYAGEALSPVEFAAAPQVGTASLRELAIETFVDGCVGETVAALEAERAAETAEDPAIAAALRQIAADEARHAELAWQIVAWCIERDPAIADGLHVDEPAFDAADDDLAAYGVLGGAARSRAYADVVREVVAPCVAALAA